MPSQVLEYIDVNGVRIFGPEVTILMDRDYDVRAVYKEVTYMEDIVGTRTIVMEQVYEYEHIWVLTGDPAPTPQAGYEVKLIQTNIFGKDLYQEYRYYEREQTP